MSCNNASVFVGSGGGERARWSRVLQGAIKGQIAGCTTLFTEDGETPWRRHIWAREMRAAIAKHNEHAKGKQRISTDASVYSFRHARISELLTNLWNRPNNGGGPDRHERGDDLRFIPSAMQEKLAALKG